MAEVAVEEKKSLYIIDGSSYVYRAFYAIKQFLSNAQNFPTNAIYGFALMLQKLITSEQPDYLVVVFDAKGKTFRHDQYPAYKAHRPPMPEDLVPQLPLIKKLVKAFNLLILEKEGVEADDVIGTLARMAQANLNVTLVSSDKDLMQLVTGNVCMLDTMKDKRYTEREVIEKFGVGPDKVIDILGLMGDKSDNIPGVPGVGEKTAIKLIQEYGSIENLIDNSSTISRPALKKKIEEFKEQALLSKQLATIVTDLDIGIALDELTTTTPDNEALLSLFRELEFTSLLKELTSLSDQSGKEYHLVDSKEKFDALITELKKQPAFSVDTETTAKEPMLADIVGISFSFKDNEGFYIPFGHSYEGIGAQLDRKEVLDALGPILEDSTIKKYGQNIKYEIIVFKKCGITLQGIAFDTMLASYVLHPSQNRHSLDSLALEHLNYRKISYSEVAGKGVKQVCFSQVELHKASDYSCEDADTTWLLTSLLKKQLQEEGLFRLYNDVELPLIEVLSRVEMNGVKIDTSLLQEMSEDLRKDIVQLQEEIYIIAGEEFNINSPQQLAKILFEKLGLKPGKKKKTGYSTDVEVLEKLSLDHILPKKLLEFRQLVKLTSTYVDALPKLVNPVTKRIHTSFNQTIAATGRLSSSKPNLQNIPIKTALGKRMRAAFIPEEGRSILSADYSQVELRILAHMAKDKNLIASFLNEEDIHTKTASEVLGIFPALVTPEMRRIAKSINFGIIYGISPFGLSRELGISRSVAKDYIDTYFSRYPKVILFMDKVISDAYDTGYVSTLFGRRRYFPDLHSKNRQVKNFAERSAANTPIQGTAADIIKLAMIAIDRKIQEQKFSAKMIMQVHDELVFEIPDNEIDEMTTLVKLEMEQVVQLDVPLTVNIVVGANWNEAH